MAVDLAELDENYQRSRMETLGSKIDFESARRNVRVMPAGSGAGVLQKFLDWSFAILIDIPTDWRTFTLNDDLELEKFLSTIEGTVNEIASTSRVNPVLDMASDSFSSVKTLSERAIHSQASLSVSLAAKLFILMNIGRQRRENTAQHSQRMSDVLSEISEARDVAKSSSAEAKVILEETARSAASVVAVGRAKLFAVSAKKHAVSANIWLIILTVLSLALIVIATLIITDRFAHPKTDGNIDLANYILGRFLLLGTVTGASIFASRQYSTYRHNSILDSHRSNALITYRVLAKATQGDEAHDQILSEAARAIFLPAETGFIRPTGQDQASMIQLIQGMSKVPAAP